MKEAKYEAKINRERERNKYSYIERNVEVEKNGAGNRKRKKF